MIDGLVKRGKNETSVESSFLRCEQTDVDSLTSMHHYPVKDVNRKRPRCRECMRTLGKIVRSSFVCCTCRVGLCIGCFATYHEKKDLNLTSVSCEETESE